MKIVTPEQIQRLANRAYEGNTDALKQLNIVIRKQADIARKRIKRLEKSGLGGSKLAQYQYFLDVTFGGVPSGKKIKDIKAASADDLIEAAKITAKFLSGKTSTVSGMKAYRAEIGKEWNAHEKEEIDTLDDFLTSDMWKDLKKYIGSKEVKSTIEEVFNMGDASEDLQRLFDDYNSRTEKHKSIGKAWEDWKQSVSNTGDNEGGEDDGDNSRDK